MSLLDADSEELKKNSLTEGTSGRKVNQSGLGAFKGLNKYSKLTNKYRTTPVEPTVEHSRGTFSKENESQCIVGAKSVQEAPVIPILEAFPSDQNSVQTQCEVSAAVDLDSAVFLNVEQDLKSVQAPSEVSAKSVQEHDIDASLLDKLTLDNMAKTLIFSMADEHEKQLINSSVSAKSVQSGVDEIFEVFAQPSPTGAWDDESKVGVKSVRTRAELLPDSTFFENPKSVQSQSEVSAKSVRAEGGDLIINCKSKTISKDISVNKPLESILSLSGSQRTIVEHLFDLCVWNNSLVTPPITIANLSAETGINHETAVSSIKRLRNKYIIDRHSYKDGKGGWTQYKISDVTYRELLQYKKSGPPEERQESYTRAPMQAASIAKDNGAWFKELDFTSVKPISPMVVNPAIRALVADKLTPDMVQDFINRFTAWMSQQSNITSPFGIFCDKLKEYAKEGDSPVLLCMTKDELEAEALYIEEIKLAKYKLQQIEDDRSKTIQVENEKRFAAWYESATDMDLIKMLEPTSFLSLRSEVYERTIRGIYLGLDTSN